MFTVNCTSMTSLIGPLLVPFTQAKRSADIHRVLGLHVYSKLYQSYHDTANEKKNPKPYTYTYKTSVRCRKLICLTRKKKGQILSSKSLASFPDFHTAVDHTAVNEMVGGALRKG